MTDRELLELAAKAAGIKTSLHKETDSLWVDGPRVWNPLTDSGDAFRLAVKFQFKFEIDMVRSKIAIRHSDIKILEDYDSDPSRATRRAIVRAAAEIGKGMK